MKKVDLRSAQIKMAELLKEFDKVCEENNLQYWMESGTALGAVRHKGFIPWDDDVDVAMLREDYNKLIELNENNMLPKDMLLQLPSTDERAYISWVKIRRPYDSDDTESYDELIRMDVFPYDYYDEKKIEAKKQLRKNLMFTKGVVEYSENSLKKPFVNNLKINFKIIGCRFLNKVVVRKDNRALRQYIIDNSKSVIEEKVDMKNARVGYGVEVIDYGVEENQAKHYFRPDIIFPTRKIEFEGIMLSAPGKCEEYLKSVYGSNYMQYPKEEDRITHFPEIFGF